MVIADACGVGYEQEEARSLYLLRFGHQHQTYRETREKNGHQTYFFCCPSMTEYSAEDTGFYSFSFRDDYFEEALYCWRKPFFKLTEEKRS